MTPSSRALPHRPIPAPRRIPALVAVTLLATFAACEPATPPPGEDSVAFVGATIWTGAGQAPVEGATMVVRDGRVVSVDTEGAVPEGAEVVELDGRWIIPGLIDVHAHVTGGWADASVEDDTARMARDLLLFARHGVTTVNSLGGAPLEAAAYLRDTEDRPAPGRARLQFAGEVVTGPGPEEAVDQVSANARGGVDWIKLRVDDNLGTTDRMAWDAVEATLAEAAILGIPVATHIFYRADALRLLKMGTGMIAHSVRDLPVEPSFAEALEEAGACYVPTLTREITTFAYAERPDWFDDPLFKRWADSATIARVTDPEFQARMAGSSAAEGYRAGLEVARTNLATLHEAGAPVAMGTDAGPATRFPGFLEHRELEMMVDAGLEPREALTAATAHAAACLGRADIGVLERGRWADFLVLSEDPLADITATRALEAVYIGGGRVPF